MARQNRVSRPMNKQMAHIVQRYEKLIVTSSSRTRDGIWVVNDCFFILEANADDETLGKAVAKALLSSQTDVPDPALGHTPPGLKALLKALGVRNFKVYLEGTKAVEVLNDDEQPGLRIVPMENAGPRTGLIEIIDAEEQLPRTDDPSSLADAIRRAFARAT